MKVVDAKLQGNFFDEKSNQYDPSGIINPPYYTSVELSLMLTKLDGKRGDEVIDFGSGNGRLTIPLLRQNYTVMAVDVSDHSLRDLLSIASKLNLTKPETTSILPKKGLYYAVVGTDILHHVDMDHYLPSFYNILKKNGKIVFSEPCAFNIAWYIFLMFFKDWQMEKGLINCTYFNFERLLKKYKFRNITIIGLGLLPRPFFSWSKTLCRFNDWLGNRRFLKLFAYRYIIEARK